MLLTALTLALSTGLLCWGVVHLQHDVHVFLAAGDRRESLVKHVQLLLDVVARGLFLHLDQLDSARTPVLHVGQHVFSSLDFVVTVAENEKIQQSLWCSRQKPLHIP